MRTAEEILKNNFPDVSFPEPMKTESINLINDARIEVIKECALKVSVENQPLYQSILSLINEVK